MRRDIFVVIFFISYLQFVLTQPIVIDNPTSYPTGQPTNFTDSPYFDANVILIVSLLLIFFAACMFGWLCLPFRVALLQCCIPEPSISEIRWVEFSGLILDFIGITLLLVAIVLYQDWLWIILVVILYLLFVCATIFFFRRNSPEHYQTPFGYVPIADRDADLPPDVEAFIVSERPVYDDKGKVII